MNLNVLKLWKSLLKLAEIETDKAKLIVESEVAEGVEVFVEKEGEFVPAEDGEYIAEDKIIVVAEGKIVEVREKEVEPEQEPEETTTEEISASKSKFNAVKEKFEASYQEIEANIYSALDKAGVWGYLVENGNDYAIVAEWDINDDREHLFRYSITIDENGFVTLGEKHEVRVEYVDVDKPETEVTEEISVEEFNATIAERDAKIAELEALIAEKQAQLEMSADEPAKNKIKKEVKSGALKYFN